MSDLWYYTQADQTLGPVSAAQLRQLAAAGKLEATDLIWPEGKDRAQGVPAQAAIDFSTPAPPASSGAVQPDWLDDVRAAEAKPSPPPLPSPTRGEGETGAPAGLPAHTPQGEGGVGGQPPEVRLLGPAEAPVFRLKGYYRFHFQLQSSSPGMLHQVLRAVLPAQRPPAGVEFTLDVDPFNML